MLNKYRRMQVISDSDPEKLMERIRAFTEMFDIIALYGVNGRHYAWLRFDRPMDMRLENNSKKKAKSLEQITKELNKE
jgi:uncharacterized protein (DUF2249 family)